MKLTCLLVTIGCTGLQLLMANPGKGQELNEVRVSLELRNEPLRTAFSRIEKQTDFRFAYNRQQVDKSGNVSLPRGSYTVDRALQLLLANTHLLFKLVNNKIIVFRAGDPAGDLSAIPDAQNEGSVKGKVTNDKDEPIVGASIVLVGTDKGASAGLSGEFTIGGIKPGKYKIQASAIGYQNIQRDITIGEGQALELNFQLRPGGNNLNEVVVTGYSRQNKRDVTGAASTISADVVAQTPATDITGVLQGRAAGVSVDEQGGPGSSQVVRIRGISTIGNNDPLYVIDGVQIRMGQGSGQVGSQDISSLLNPGDIESISILKDPSLTTLYGSEGSNGVIVITTRSGKMGAPKLEYSTYVGYESPKKLPNFITPQQQADALYNSYLNSTPAQTPQPISFYGTGNTPVLPDYIIENGSANLGVAAGSPLAAANLYNLRTYRILKTNKAGTNWFKELFKPAFTQNHQLSLSGATDKSNYALTFGYLNDQGMELNSYFKRYSLRVNTQFKPQPWLRVGENVELSYTDANGGQKRTGNTFNNDIGAIFALSPLLPTHDIAGNLAGTKNTTVLGGGNPLISRTNSTDSKAYTQSIIGSAYLEVGPVKGFTYTNQIGFQFVPNEFHYYLPGLFQEPLADTSNIFSEGSGYSTDWRWLNKLSWSTTIASIHRITAFAGYEAHAFSYRSSQGVTGNLASSAASNQYLGSGNTGTDTFYTPIVYGGGDKYTGVSAFGNATYSLLDKYFATGTFRRDGSSKFGISSTYGNFWAASAGWRLSKETFMDRYVWLNDLKLRASYGESGNDAIITEAYNDVYTSDAFGAYDLGGTNTSSQAGYYLSSFGNSGVHWEANHTTNIGFDAALFNNKLTASFNWFNKETIGLLYNPVTSGTQGSAASAVQNIMNFSNKGIELELGYNGQSGQFRYEMSGNIATYRNRVNYIDGVASSHLDGGFVGSGGGTPLTRSVVGRPISSFYGYVYEGLFQNAQEVADHASETVFGITSLNALGHVKYKDLNHDNVINSDSDRTFLGDPNPKFTYGYNLSLYYGNFDLGIFIQGVYGNKIFNYGRVMTQMPNGLATGRGGLEVGALDTWTQANPNAKLPIFSQGSGVNDLSPSSFFIESGSYLRVKILQLGYTLPKFKGVNKIRLYLQAYNLLTITHYSGQDPAVNDGNPNGLGIDYGTAYPISRKFLLGVNLNL